jgi:formamidopyrimidine-DNA glycosylase
MIKIIDNACIVYNLNAKIINITSKGKKIIFMVENNGNTIYFISSLLMSGLWLFNEDKYTKIIIHLDDKELFFDDMRNYGIFDIAYNQEQLNNIIKDIGPDFLNGEVSESDYIKRIKSLKNKEICQFMMEQKYFSGVGNYLKSKILNKCGIMPNRLLDALSDDDIHKLYKYTIKILFRSYDEDGYESYKDPYGNSGKFKPKIYMKKMYKNNKIFFREFKDKRISYYVLETQS